MGIKSRETIYGASVRAAAERAAEARKVADPLGCEAGAYSAARGALLRFKPKTMLQAVDFLTFLAGEPNFCGNDELAVCLRNMPPRSVR